MSPLPPSPTAVALRWIVCPSAHLQSAPWLLQARTRQFQVIASPWSAWHDDRAAIAAWAQTVRQHRLVAALLVPLPAIGTLPVAALDAAGPLLLIVTPAQADDLQRWPQALALLAQTRWPRLRWTTLGVPTCHAADWQPDLLLVPPPARPLPSACAGCGAALRCAGPLPDQAVAPLPEPVSNQFDLTDGPAAAALLTIAGSPPRPMVLQQPLTPVVTAALARGQLYLDRSDKPRLDDFAADLELLVPTAGDAWQPAGAQPFAAEEALLLAHLRALTGVVVDVGAGPIRYVQGLAAAQAAGQLRYVAVEPELAALERTVTVLPDALCLQGTGEHLPLASQSADAVMMLRSFNHLRDVPQALREVARVLKPGGVFLACDNVAFGLCRSPTQLARAHAIPLTETPFEHYRNADAPDAAAALIAAVPNEFQVDTVQPVGLGTSNQWFLRATRR